MRIAYVITRSDEIGGAHIHVRDLSMWLQGLGHEVRVFVGGEGPFIEMLDLANVPYTRIRNMRRPISPFHDLFAVRELARKLSEFRPDIVSAHSAKAGVIARLACKLKRFPCVFTAHGWAFAEGVRWPWVGVFELLERALGRYSKYIITVCENDRKLALIKSIAPPAKIRTIYNGMPELPVIGEGPAQPQTRNGPPSLIMVARFEGQKDHYTLVKALSTLKDIPWDIKLIGDGPLLGSVRDMVSSYGMSDRVAFLGRRSDVPALLEAADIFLLITNWEGFPRSILEAMRAGLPVIATDVAGVPEAVLDCQTGYLVRPRDYVGLSGSLRKLLLSAELRQNLGRAGRERFESNFTFEKMASSTFGLYQEVLTESSIRYAHESSK